jgi:hypothetical protein
MRGTSREQTADSSLMIVAQSQLLTKVTAVHHLSRAPASPAKPFVKVADLHRVRHRDARYGHLNRVEALSDLPGPLVTAYRCESERNRFKQRRGGHFSRVRDSIHILDSHPARTETHTTR